MSHYPWCVGVAIGWSLVVGAGCDMGAKPIRPPSINPAAAAKAAVDVYDANKDGKISGEELDRCPALKNSLDKLNPKSAGVTGGDVAATRSPVKKADLKDDGITADMLQNMMDGWLKRRFGRLTYACQVYHNGQPLAGAAVKFVPEKFLGTAIPAAEGTTGMTGTASMSIPTVKPEGVTVGFYRVEITKDGEAIPAKYNTESTLGVGIVCPVNGIAASFNLKY